MLSGSLISEFYDPSKISWHDSGRRSYADGGRVEHDLCGDFVSGYRISTHSVFRLGGDLPVNRLGFGAMRITGEGIWGWPADRGNALKFLRRSVDLGIDLIDTADAYGPETSELLIAEALYPYPKDLVRPKRSNETWAWAMGAERAPGVPHPVRGE